MKVLKIILCFVLPPVAAYMQVGLTSHFWINLVLTVFFWLPGVLHGLWLVLTQKK